jgi:lipopolysaccharide transport system ATP-binding protein
MLYGMQDLARNMLGVMPKVEAGDEASPLRLDEFWALQDVSFDLKRGETMGIIGVNGSGKTTLLRILNGILPPDKGAVVIRGQVGGLIALGAGFHPHMTGRENIVLNGSILGMSRRQIGDHLEEIIDFADIRDFIDAPVATYSSGMTVRLGFAIATVQKPDLLLLDEVLAVGDVGFRIKCYNYIGKLQGQSAVILVSHSMQQITHACSRVLLLNRGQVECCVGVEEAVARYSELAGVEDGDGVGFETCEAPFTQVNLRLIPIEVKHGETLLIEGEVLSTAYVGNCRMIAFLYDSQGRQVVEWNSDTVGQNFSFAQGRSQFQIKFGPLCLRAGNYNLALNIYDAKGLLHLFWSFKKHRIIIHGVAYGSCAYQLR